MSRSIAIILRIRASRHGGPVARAVVAAALVFSVLPIGLIEGQEVRQPVIAQAPSTALTDIDPLAKELDRVRKKFRLNRALSVLVESVEPNRAIYEHAPDRRFVPASGMKLLVMAAALHYLGPSYRFETNFFTDGRLEDGVLVGNVYVQGSGDPSLTHKELDYIARRIAEAGVQEIRGHLVLDDSFFDDRMRGPASYENIYKEGLPIQSALSYNFNLVELIATPTLAGDRANILDRGHGYFTVTNRVTTAKGGRSWLSVRRVARNRVVLRGKVIEGDEHQRSRRFVSPNPPMYFGTALVGKLRSYGIQFDGQMGKGVVPAERVLLYRHESDRLVEVLGSLGRYSNNFSAEQMIKALGAHRWGVPGSFEKGTRAVAEYLVGLGFSPDEFRLYDGSGLSPDNRLTPRILVRVLKEIWNDPTLRTEVLCSLSIGGVEGTLARRYNDERYMGLVIAKTGSLASVSSLSGFAFTKSRGPVVFSIITNGIRRQARADSVEDEFVRVMLDHEPLMTTAASGESSTAVSGPLGPDPMK